MEIGEILDDEATAKAKAGKAAKAANAKVEVVVCGLLLWLVDEGKV